MLVYERSGLTGPGARRPGAILGRERGVAQSGSAPGWGPGGRRFKSSRPDDGNLIRHAAPSPGADMEARVMP